jgi:hypothetical protein
VSLNDKTAVVLILSLASSSFETPGNCTLKRLSPSKAITGSLTPKVSILLTIALYVLSKSSCVNFSPSTKGSIL